LYHDFVPYFLRFLSIATGAGGADPTDNGYRDLKAHMRGKFIFLDQTEPNQQSNKQERRKWRLATKSQRMQFAYLSATLDPISSKIVFNL
jgi:hypothetical protein